VRVWYLVGSALVLASLLTPVLIPSVVDAEVAVEFADPSLETVIRDALDQPTGDISGSDLEGLSRLTAMVAGITDLSGLEHCTGLTELTLGSNEIEDLAPLAGLTQLSILRLEGNRVQDLAPLAGLTGLTTLSLGQNDIRYCAAIRAHRPIQPLPFGESDR